MSDPERSPLAAGQALAAGMYRIERLLGKGGFALTYAAAQGRWNFAVCLKEFFPLGCLRAPTGQIESGSPQSEARRVEGLAAFRDEAACLSRFNHPGIVRVHGSFEENGTAYLVQELLDGMTLAAGLELAGNMREPTVLKVAHQVGQALLMVHAAGLIHSDLKPENIFLTADGRYVLLDFGLTRGFLSSNASRLGGRGVSAGYAPPEQYIEGKKLTPAADVYSFAATLYTLLTGQVPADAQARRKGQILTAISALNPSVSEKVENAIIEALAMDANARTQGVREFLYQLNLDLTPKAVSFKPPVFTPLWVQKAHLSSVGALCLDSTTLRLYSTDAEGELKMWSWPDLELVGQARVPDGAVTRMAVSESGRYLVTCSTRGLTRLWETDFRTEGLLLLSEESNPTGLAIRGDAVALTFADGRCCLILADAEGPSYWVAHAGPANSVDFHESGTYLVTSGQDGYVRYWELPNPRLLREFRAHGKSITSARFSTCGTNLLTSSIDHSVIFWDAIDNQKVREFQCHTASVYDAQFTQRESLAVSLCSDRILRGLSLESGQVVYASELSDRTRIMAVDPARPMLAVAVGEAIGVFQLPTARGSSGVLRPSDATRRPAPEFVSTHSLIGSVIGSYKLTAHLGSGGMAVVYKGMPVDDNDESAAVAVKLLRPDQVSTDYKERFEREIQVCMKLHHPGVVRTLDWGVQDGLSYLVMDFVDGQCLSDLIPPGGMDLARATAIFCDIVEGLSYAHSRGIVHRDLKPENVMVGKDGRAQVLDFGLARDRHVQTVTRHGSAMGTVEYISPEQLMRGPQRGHLTEKSDQYALGILVFEVLCGRRPFEWDDDPTRLAKILAMQLNEAPPSMATFRPDLPARIETVVNRMMSKDPDDRYPTVQEAGYALLQAAR